MHLLVQGEGLGVEGTQQGVEHEPLVGMAGKINEDKIHFQDQ